ncbi:MAG: DNA recombination protein RmuC [bacterium]|nr:DNA recombination protein RmuC [bacterium]
MAISPIYILTTVVLGAVLVMVGINLFYMLKSRRNADSDSSHYMVLHQRLDSFTDLMNKQLEQNRQSSERASLAVHQQVQGFTQGMTQLHENMKQMHDSVKNVSSFQDILRSPKLRGQWGEMSLEAALSQYFVKDAYDIQHYFKSGEAVDAILKLPNGTILPIDAKFNWDNFEKMVNAGNDMDKEIFRKNFYSDVKKKIDEIASKYILPSEATTDLALMYVPAETVYYELINNIKDVDIPSYARGKKIFMVSPNTFALSVSAIMHWFKDVQFSKQTKEVIQRLARISTDGEKLGENFRKLGKHISDSKSAYDDAEKRLVLMVDRVKNIVEIGETSASEEIKKINTPAS